jgi:membrane glycosyltransferase
MWFCATRRVSRFGGRWRFCISLMLELIFLPFNDANYLVKSHHIYHRLWHLGKKAGGPGRRATITLSPLPMHSSNFGRIPSLELDLLACCTSPTLQPFGMALLFFGGLLFSIPLVVLTSQAWLGRWMIDRQIVGATRGNYAASRADALTAQRP